MTKKGKLYVISGPSGVGKNTLINDFLKSNGKICLSVSCTTRAPRGNEKDGINYFFLTREEFKKRIEEGMFLEWAEFNGNYYGTDFAYVEKKLNEGKQLILEIDTTGAEQIKRKIPEAILIFIMPPDMNILRERLTKRGTEQTDVIEKRLNIALSEIKKAEQFDYTVINNELEQAVKDLSIIFNL